MDPDPADASPNTNDQQEGQGVTCEPPSLTTPSTSEDVHSMDASQDHTHNPEDSEEDEDKQEVSGDESVSTQNEDYIPTPLPMPDMSEFDVPLPPELQSTHEVDHVESATDATPLPLSSPPRILHIPELLKPMEPTGSGTSFEGIQVVHVGCEAGLKGTMQATYFCLPPGTRTTRMRCLSNDVLIEFTVDTLAQFFRSRRSATMRQSHLLYFRPRTLMAKWLDVSFRSYGRRRVERGNWDRTHDHQ